MTALGLLGVIPFVCSSSVVMTFKDLQVERSDRWATHEVIGQKPKLEYIGPQLLQVSFAIQLNSALGITPLAALVALKEMMELHEPQRLLIGPEYMGKFIIESISESRKHHSGLGICVSADVTVNLREAA
jgi:phage protein U